MIPSDAESDTATTVSPGLAELFLAFSGMAIMGFGGVLPWARRMLVEQKRWLSESEFTEVLSLGQFLPGANIINVSVVVGARFRGIPGSIASMAGLLAGPIAVVILLGGVYLHYGQRPWVHGGLAGVTMAASGLILAMAAKMAVPLFRRDAIVGSSIAALTFAAIGLGGIPLHWVLLALLPISCALAWWRLR